MTNRKRNGTGGRCLCGHAAREHLPLRGPCKHHDYGEFCPCARLDEARLPFGGNGVEAAQPVAGPAQALRPAVQS